MMDGSGSDVTNHEAMRVLILGRFEDDVLLRQEVELWLDDLIAPGEPVLRVSHEKGERNRMPSMKMLILLFGLGMVLLFFLYELAALLSSESAVLNKIRQNPEYEAFISRAL